MAYVDKLINACKSGNLQNIKEFINKDQINEDNGGWPLIHWAAHFGHLDIVIYLHQNGSQIDIKAHDEWTPIYEAARAGHCEIVKYLHQHGAQIDVKDKYGWSPINLAILNGNLEVASYLIPFFNISKIQPLDEKYIAILKQNIFKQLDPNMPTDAIHEVDGMATAVGSSDVANLIMKFI